MLIVIISILFAMYISTKNNSNSQILVILTEKENILILAFVIFFIMYCIYISKSVINLPIYKDVIGV